MLKSISWGHYFASLLFAVLIYYIATGYCVFRNELLRFAGRARQNPDGFFSAPAPSLDVTGSSGDIDITPLIQAFTGEAEAYLEQAAVDKTVKQEILFALQQLSARYPILAHSDYKMSLAKDIHHLTTRYLPAVFSINELTPYLFT